MYYKWTPPPIDLTVVWSDAIPELLCELKTKHETSFCSSTHQHNQTYSSACMVFAVPVQVHLLMPAEAGGLSTVRTCLSNWFKPVLVGVRVLGEF